MHQCTMSCNIGSKCKVKVTVKKAPIHQWPYDFLKKSVLDVNLYNSSIIVPFLHCSCILVKCILLHFQGLIYNPSTTCLVGAAWTRNIAAGLWQKCTPCPNATEFRPIRPENISSGKNKAWKYLGQKCRNMTGKITWWGGACTQCVG